MSQILLKKEEVEELMDTFDFQKSKYLQKIEKLISDISRIDKNQKSLHQEFLEIVHRDNKFFMDKAFVYRALDEKEIQVVEKIKQFDKLNSRLLKIEENAFQQLENSILNIKNNDFFEPLKLQIKQEQLNFEKELKEAKKIVTEKLAFLKLEVFEFNTNITTQIKNIEVASDLINNKYKNYLKDVEKQGQELLSSFQKIEVNRDKNLKLVLYITVGISITTLIACGAILFKLIKLFH
ncbi:hypothetical protein L5F39_06750 [Aliarcobacter butzleri]|uniref:hypothetical protein n=1 Tax=Aliarcobacter butzleri TaxID=28197 RepID=UPI001EDD779F|nr:hypothetical protein [Aliarcobacter butzleri]MCG3697305.1 hypothetical protein [Aliarcobacter butzleri]